MTRVNSASWTAGVLVLLGMIAGPASAQLSSDRLAGLPAQTGLGLGRVRLSGMGGFVTAVPDENAEIRLYDFTGNPAGFGDDRDSWSIDVRFSHMEYADGERAPAGDDVKVNDGTFALAFHRPGRFGVGGAIDYSEAAARDATRTREAYRVAGFDLIGSLYLFPKVVAGLTLGYSDETQSVSSREIYRIEHNGTQPHVGMGLAFLPVAGVTLGIRGDAFPTTIEGSSKSSTHDDTFDWERPGSSWSAHALLDRGRLEAAIDYGSEDVEGKETVQLSWSERFIWNPTPDPLRLEEDTFSEDRSGDAMRARARLEVMPGRLSVSGAWADESDDFTIVSNPNALGSLERGRAEGSRTAWAVGAAYTMARERLLLGAELQGVSSELDRSGVTSSTQLDRDTFNIRLGGEYLAGEKIAVRAGIVRGDEDRTVLTYDEGSGGFVSDPLHSGSFGSWRLATGLGLVPWGGIWQLDLAYQVTLDSDESEDQSEFGAYIRYLF